MSGVLLQAMSLSHRVNGSSLQPWCNCPGGSMGRSLSLWWTCCTMCNMSATKDIPFRPAGGESHPLNGQPRTSCYVTRGTRWRWFRPGARPEGRCAGGRMGLVVSCSHTICTMCKWCVNTIENLPPGRRRYRLPGSVTAYVMLFYRRYAVRIQTRCLTRWKSDSPAVAWYVLFLVHETLALRANVS